MEGFKKREKRNEKKNPRSKQRISKQREKGTRKPVDKKSQNLQDIKEEDEEESIPSLIQKILSYLSGDLIRETESSEQKTSIEKENKTETYQSNIEDRIEITEDSKNETEPVKTQKNKVMKTPDDEEMQIKKTKLQYKQDKKRPIEKEDKKLKSGWKEKIAGVKDKIMKDWIAQPFPNTRHDSKDESSVKISLKQDNSLSDHQLKIGRSPSSSVKSVSQWLPAQSDMTEVKSKDQSLSDEEEVEESVEVEPPGSTVDSQQEYKTSSLPVVPKIRKFYTRFLKDESEDVKQEVASSPSPSITDADSSQKPPSVITKQTTTKKLDRANKPITDDVSEPCYCRTKRNIEPVDESDVWLLMKRHEICVSRNCSICGRCTVPPPECVCEARKKEHKLAIYHTTRFDYCRCFYCNCLQNTTRSKDRRLK